MVTFVQRLACFDNAEEPMRVAAKVASDLSPFGMALGEMIRTLDVLDKHLAAVCAEIASAHEAAE